MTPRTAAGDPVLAKQGSIVTETPRWSDRIRKWQMSAAIAWLALAAIILVCALSPVGPDPSWILSLYAGLTVSMSLVSFAFYGIDKRRARRNQQRIPERRLHLFALLGGWPGALIAQRTFRHKTLKTTFRMLYWLIVFLHVSVAVYCLGDSLFGG
ncbi:MAG: DUF1294 domain-containing protein [Planctomycetaceae bacterium]